jgi:hypothetical protein
MGRRSANDDRDARMRAYAPGRTCQEVADHCGVSYAVAYRVCRGLLRTITTGIDWAAVDWLLADATLARQLGCTRELVRLRRRDLKRPPSPVKGLHPDSRRPVVVASLARLGDDLGRLAHYCVGTRELAALLAVDERGMRGLAEGAGTPIPVATIHPWHAMDWRLPNTVLERAWQLSPGTACDRRSTQQLGPAAYNLLSRIATEPGRLFAVAQEEEKAERWRAGRAALLKRIAARVARHAARLAKGRQAVV